VMEMESPTAGEETCVFIDFSGLESYAKEG
jgi:hypothetical protein